MKTRYLALILALGLFPGCASHSPPRVATAPIGYVEAGSVTPHEVWKVKRALSRAGISAYTDGANYPLPYRILVPPDKRNEAADVILRTKKIKTG